jgi:hypothetical protein
MPSGVNDGGQHGHVVTPGLGRGPAQAFGHALQRLPVTDDLQVVAHHGMEYDMLRPKPTPVPPTMMSSSPARA